MMISEGEQLNGQILSRAFATALTKVQCFGYHVSVASVDFPKIPADVNSQ
jgi:hypothetical protein